MRKQPLLMLELQLTKGFCRVTRVIAAELNDVAATPLSEVMTCAPICMDCSLPLTAKVCSFVFSYPLSNLSYCDAAGCFEKDD